MNCNSPIMLMCSSRRSESFEASIAPWLSVSNAVDAINFYKAAFGAVELYRLEEGDGQVAIAELSVGGANFWIQEEADAIPEMVGRGSFRMIITVNDPDFLFDLALAAGATEIVPINEEHGWRIGRVVDRFGYHWEIGKRLIE